MTRTELHDVLQSSKDGQIQKKAAYSRFWQRLERRYADLWAILPSGVPDRDSMQTAFDTLCAHNPALRADPGAVLRIIRHWVMVRLMALTAKSTPRFRPSL